MGKTRAVFADCTPEADAMTRSRGMSPHRRAWHVAGLTAALALLLPSAAIASGGPDDLPPVVSDVSVTPDVFAYTGGTLAVSADVTDDYDVYQVFVSVSRTGYSQNTALANSGTSLYQGYADIPANYGDEVLVYSVQVVAEDSNGAFSSAPASQVTVQVQPPPPDVQDPLVTPSSLPSTGGDVTIGATATASDEHSISEIYGVVTLPGDGPSVVPLTGTGGASYEGVFSAPANSTSSLQTYTVQISALDDMGQQTTIDAPAFTVAGSPPPVAPSKLHVSRRSVSFGHASLDEQVTRTVVLTNRGDAAPVSGTLSLTGSRFRLVEGPSISFTLAAGESMRVALAYRSAEKGHHRGLVTIDRDDGLQPGLQVRLRGVTGARGGSRPVASSTQQPSGAG